MNSELAFYVSVSRTYPKWRASPTNRSPTRIVPKWNIRRLLRDSSHEYCTIRHASFMSAPDFRRHGPEASIHWQDIEMSPRIQRTWPLSKFNVTDRVSWVVGHHVGNINNRCVVYFYVQATGSSRIEFTDILRSSLRLKIDEEWGYVDRRIDTISSFDRATTQTQILAVIMWVPHPPDPYWSCLTAPPSLSSRRYFSS